jgi:hypothetical protein
MSKIILVAILCFVGLVAWKIGNALSSDAISMAVGVVFGVMAGLPTAILCLDRNAQSNKPASSGRRCADDAGQWVVLDPETHQQISRKQLPLEVRK